MKRTALHTARRLTQKPARADQQDGDQQQIGQEIGPGSKISLHEHVGEPVRHPAERGAKWVTKRSDDDYGK